MSYLPKIIGAAALYLAAGALAQTIDLPAVFVYTKGKCLDMNTTEKIPATMKVLDGPTSRFAANLPPRSPSRATPSKSATIKAKART